jgi:hypothetical protein
VVGVNVNWEAVRRAAEGKRAEAYRVADAADRIAKSKPQPKEDDEGFLVGRTTIQGSPWRVPEDDEWRQGEKLPWLHGEAS